MQDIRSRTITFRISDAEYERLKSLCSVVGARSTSEAARMAVANLAQEDFLNRDDYVSQRIRQLERKVSVLNRKVEDISQLVTNSSNGTVGRP